VQCDDIVNGITGACEGCDYEGELPDEHRLLPFWIKPKLTVCEAQIVKSGVKSGQLSPYSTVQALIRDEYNTRNGVNAKQDSTRKGIYNSFANQSTKFIKAKKRVSWNAEPDAMERNRSAESTRHLFAAEEVQARRKIERVEREGHWCLIHFFLDLKYGKNHKPLTGVGPFERLSDLNDACRRMYGFAEFRSVTS